MKMKKIALLIIAFFIINIPIKANNLAISNVKLKGQDVANHFSLIEFDISWDNSWRISTGPSNWDAAWVFAKYRLKSQTTWNHALLNWVDGTGSGDGHTEPANVNIASSNDNGSGNAYGVFIYHDTDMNQGSVNYTGVQLRWEYGDNGLANDDSVELYVFAIEMVYVPQGNFYVGSGGTETGAFYTYPTTTNPYQITSENAISVGTTAGNLYYSPGAHIGDQSGPIPAAYPKGYKAFYCMKYEITQGQYVAFLNNLTTAQAHTRKYTITGKRYAITGSSPGNYTTTNPYVACNYLSWADVAAYLDWAALRPMTELEFEKSCRGTSAPVANEYAWGTTTIASSAYTLSNAGANDETITTGYSTTAGNVLYSSTIGSINGPIRSGIFAANSNNTGRVTAGSSYYGIMELSGNMWERTVTVGNTTGRAFTGTNGNGSLDASGNADVTNWPNSTASGSGFRGGIWTSNATFLCLSNRSFPAFTYINRGMDTGGRGVRVAP